MTIRIVIAGGGVIGLATAALLQSRLPAGRAEITLVDPSDGPPPDTGDVELRVSAIAPGSADLLSEIGAWSLIDPGRCNPYQRMCVWDAADSEDSSRAVSFDAAEFSLQELGYIVENAAIQRALYAALEGSPAVQLRYGLAIDSLDIDGTLKGIVLSNGERLACDLLVAADGVRSPIRDMLGIGVTEHDYQQSALVTHLRPERPHESTAWQRFLSDGPVALLPLADGRVSTVWSVPTDDIDNLLALDADELGARVTAASDQVLGALTVDGPVGRFPLIARHAREYSKDGVALIGDSAHGIHPMAGQGANLGLRDADVLSDCIRDAVAEGEHPASRRVLRRYERLRRGDNAVMMNGLTALDKLFSNRNSLVGELRRNGMSLFNRLAPLRRGAIQTAIGRPLE